MRTRFQSPLEYRLLLNHRLLQAYVSGNDIASKEALDACQRAVQINMSEDVLFPLALLAARGEQGRAVSYMHAQLARYPDGYLPQWQEFLRQFASGRTPAIPELPPSWVDSEIMQALAADMCKQPERARLWYGRVSATRAEHWREFIAWRLR
ncbi:MAG: hypothetical protein ACOCXA_01215 [Planctomycetota bacterium]